MTDSPSTRAARPATTRERRRSPCAVLLALLAGAGCVATSADRPPAELFIRGGSSQVLSPRDEQASLALSAGTRAELVGRFDDARQAYYAVATHDPSNLRAVLAHSRALVAAGRGDQAADLLLSAQAGAAEQPQLLAATGAVLLASGGEERAVEHLARAHALQPLSLNTRDQLVAALLLSGRHEAAIEALAGAHPADLPDHLVLPVGRAALVADRAEAAAACFAEAARRWAGERAGWIGLGRAELLQRRLPEARDALLTALAIQPDDAEALTLLGHVRWLSGDALRAGRCWDTALANGADPALIEPLRAMAAAARAAR